MLHSDILFIPTCHMVDQWSWHVCHSRGKLIFIYFLELLCITSFASSCLLWFGCFFLKNMGKTNYALNWMVGRSHVLLRIKLYVTRRKSGIYLLLGGCFYCHLSLYCSIRLWFVFLCSSNWWKLKDLMFGPFSDCFGRVIGSYKRRAVRYLL